MEAKINVATFFNGYYSDTICSVAWPVPHVVKIIIEKETGAVKGNGESLL